MADFSKFKERRIALGFTLRDVERITGRELSNAYLSQLENGKIQRPSAHVVLCLCAAYAVSYKDALSWLQIEVEISPPKICHACGQALPLEVAVDTRTALAKHRSAGE